MNRQFKVNYDFKIERLSNIHALLPKCGGGTAADSGVLEQVLDEVQKMNGVYRRENEEMIK